MPPRRPEASPVPQRGAGLRRRPRGDAPRAAAAAAHLSSVDPVLRVRIDGLGVESPRRGVVGFEGLASAILYQQISGAAGDAIVRKLRAQAPATRLPPADWFAEVSEVRLRSCGVSPQKARYLRDLAARTLDGRLDLPGLARAPDDEVLERLTEVLGIGRWTAEMYLLFALRRPDILPVDDLGVRKAVREAYGFRSLPSGATILRLGEPWRPWRSYATHYLWRSLQRPSWEGLEDARTSLRELRRRRRK